MAKADGSVYSHSRARRQVGSARSLASITAMTMPTMSTMPLPTGWLNTPLARPGQFGASTMYRGHTRLGAENWQMLTIVEYAAKPRIDHNTNRTADSRVNSRLPSRYIVNGMIVLTSM